MESARGNKVANQFIINEEGHEVFQSYDSIIAIKYTNGVVVLDRDKWNYSMTTGKYRNKFLGEDKKATQRKIDLGLYELKDLNGGN